MADKPNGPKITPHNLDLFTEPVRDIYTALEQQLFLMIAKRLKTSPTHAEDYVLQWQVEKLQELRALNEETIRELAKTTGHAADVIRETVTAVGRGTIETVDGELQAVFPPLPHPGNLDAILEAYVAQTFVELDNFVNQTLISTNYGEGTVTRMYRKIIEETTGKVLAGTTTINKAMAETVIKWDQKGIDTAFVDRGGHRWSLERYADTVIRSTVNRTYNELRLSRMGDYGVDLVLVNSYPDARPACSAIQGKVASMSRPSSHPDYPSIYEFGYGRPDGIRGINCRHILYPFVEGINENNQIQYDPYDARMRGETVQKQRYYERQVRKAKRSLKLAEEVGDPGTIERYKKLVRNRQAAVREFVAENNLPRRYDKERVII